MPAVLEHLNVTVADSKATAAWLGDVFGWRVRWEGDSIHGGYSMHVGEDDSYIALYTPPNSPSANGARDNYFRQNGLNHIGVTVEDLDATEDKVKAAGFEPGSHADYEPGRRFYFHDTDGVEWEVVSYA
ncbi:MAG: VOC family protein [Pseudomonadota bacterium]